MRRLGETLNGLGQAALLAATLFAHPALAQDSSKAATKPVRQVVVSIPDRKLALVEGGRTLKLYSVAVGAPESPSPEGDFKVITRIENPTFYKPGTVIEPGPDNPLGSRWIGFNRKGYGIHGTNLPASIGQAASHGCIRMHQSDLEELFKLLRPGDQVTIRADRDDELAKVMTPEPVTTAEAGELDLLGEAKN